MKLQTNIEHFFGGRFQPFLFPLFSDLPPGAASLRGGPRSTVVFERPQVSEVVGNKALWKVPAARAASKIMYIGGGWVGAVHLLLVCQLFDR